MAARLAVISSAGPVDVTGAQSLRVGYGSGPVAVKDLAGDLSVDQRDGSLQAADIGGDVSIDGIVGAVTVDGVTGGLTVRDNQGRSLRATLGGAGGAG
ncbi:MAG: hypothetical protein R3F59_08135 [Myxococcota bacterium]